MAGQDITIGELPLLAIDDITPETILTCVKDGLNYRLPYSTIKVLAMNTLYSDRPLGEMSLTAVASQEFSGADFSKIEAFDKIQYERLMSVDITTNSITIAEPGNYKASLSINAEFPSSKGVEFALMVDGLVSEALGIVQGLGSGKPIYIGGSDIDPMNTGQVLTVGARDDAGGTIDVTFHKVRLIVERV